MYYHLGDQKVNTECDIIAMVCSDAKHCHALVRLSNMEEEVVKVFSDAEDMFEYLHTVTCKVLEEEDSKKSNGEHVEQCLFGAVPSIPDCRAWLLAVLAERD